MPLKVVKMETPDLKSMDILALNDWLEKAGIPEEFCNTFEGKGVGTFI